MESEDLNLTDISLYSFRNFDCLDIASLSLFTLLIGPNATGKTTVLEAVQMMTALQSFRTSKYQQMVAWNHECAQVKAHFQSNTRNISLELDIAEGKRNYLLNEKKKKIQDLKGMVPAVTFSPDDLQLVKSTNSIKRRAIDTIGTQISSSHYMTKRDYESLVKQKNQLLKEEVDITYLKSLNDVLMRAGVQLVIYRMEVLKRIRRYFQEYHRSITGSSDVVGITYIPSWVKDDGSEEEFSREQALRDFSEGLLQSIDKEIQRQRCSIGPHLDKVIFTINGHDAVDYASQGQQRSLVLAFKLAELEVIKNASEQRPLLLLDDVMSELDKTRREAFLSFISKDIQTILTATSAESFPAWVNDSAKVINLGEES